jgi:hypothetical protein
MFYGTGTNFRNMLECLSLARFLSIFYQTESSLLPKFVVYGQKSILKLGPGRNFKTLFMSVI